MTLESDRKVTETEAHTLFRLSQQGNLDAYGRLVNLHESEVMTLIAQMLGTSLADEAVQEIARVVFADAWRELRQVRRPSEFPGWLFRRAIAAGVRRAQAVSGSPWATLPAQELAAVRLHYTRGASLKETARLLHCSANEARALLWEAVRHWWEAKELACTVPG